MYSVYILRDMNGKAYVGTTSTPLEVRWRNGSGYRFCEGLWEVIRQFGWESIAKEVVAVGLSKSAASDLEQRLIAKLDTTNPDKGYNRELGGVNDQKKVSDRSREKMRKSKTGELNPNYGKHFSKEHRAKISASNSGQKRSAETRERIGKVKEKPVNQYTLSGTLVAQCESGKKAGIETGIDHRHISKVCLHQRATAGGYRWEFA